MPYFDSYLSSFIPELKERLKTPPTLLGLSGPLGIGKTTFTQELLSKLGLRDSSVQSPTFLKLIEHPVPGLGLCLHLDCYRMSDTRELDVLSLEMYSEAALWVVEWPELLIEYLKTHSELRRV